MVRIQVREAHLDALALIARREGGLGLRLATRHVAGILAWCSFHKSRSAAAPNPRNTRKAGERQKRVCVLS